MVDLRCRMCTLGHASDLLATAPSHLAAAARNFRYFNLAVVVDMLGDLTEIAHVEPLPATGHFI